MLHFVSSVFCSVLPGALFVDIVAAVGLRDCCLVLAFGCMETFPFKML
jgi:hypothetical protein